MLYLVYHHSVFHGNFLCQNIEPMSRSYAILKLAAFD